MYTHLKKHEPRRNLARSYRMAVQPNLLGEWMLHREWGRIGHGGRARMDWYNREKEAVTALLALENGIRRSGYFVEPQQLFLS